MWCRSGIASADTAFGSQNVTRTYLGASEICYGRNCGYVFECHTLKLVCLIGFAGQAVKDHATLRSLTALIASLPATENKAFRDEFETVLAIRYLLGHLLTTIQRHGRSTRTSNSPPFYLR